MLFYEKVTLDIYHVILYLAYAYPFYEPVDHVALKLADYTTIITRPMDLGTIRKKLANSSYEEPEEVADDVKLMFNNCFVYNPDTHEVVAMGKKLEAIFETR